MLEHIKSHIIYSVYVILSKVQWITDHSKLLLVIQKKAKMHWLYRDDIVAWREERAREIGVKFGEECRFFSLDIQSEPYLLTLGDRVIVSGNVVFITHDGSTIFLETGEEGTVYAPIKIGDNCFIGLGAVILPGTVIGDNCIVGVGSIVRGTIADNSVVMGNPAKVVFKTSMLIKLQKNSKGYIRHPFKISREEKKQLVLEKLNIKDHG